MINSSKKFMYVIQRNDGQFYAERPTEGDVWCEDIIRSIIVNDKFSAHKICGSLTNDGYVCTVKTVSYYIEINIVAPIEKENKNV